MVQTGMTTPYQAFAQNGSPAAAGGAATAGQPPPTDPASLSPLKAAATPDLKNSNVNGGNTGADPGAGGGGNGNPAPNQQNGVAVNGADGSGNAQGQPGQQGQAVRTQKLFKKSPFFCV